MFGLNENEAQATNTNDTAHTAASSVTQSNPFADTPSSDPAPAASLSPAPMPSDQSTATPSASHDTATGPSDDLLQLKEQALRGLQPLVSHLDQTPEEKFKTTMMLIQATDNPGLVKEAYEAANQIPDEKARAQALLDVVNEINYFTQRGEDEDKS